MVARWFRLSDRGRNGGMIRYSISTLILITLATAVGVVAFQYWNRSLVISEVPRPNSGQFTNTEAEEILDDCLAQSIGISTDHQLIQRWKNPYIGFHIHIDSQGQIAVTDFFGKKSNGMTAIKPALDLTHSFLEGNPGGVLLTSETNGWDTPEKRAIVKSVFEPSIHLFIVTALENGG